VNIDISIDGKFAKRFLDAAIEGITKKTESSLKVAAIKAEQIILDRTEKGIGYQGRFARYSSGYAKAKRAGWKKTPKRKGFSGDASGIVNLMVTGNMLGAITHKAKKDQARLFFTRATEAKKAAFNNAKRPFFGLNAGEIDQVRRAFVRKFET
jgi:hypothetical protein